MTTGDRPPKRLIIAPRAKADLRGIRRYIAESSPYYAQEFVADLTAKIIWIAARTLPARLAIIFPPVFAPFPIVNAASIIAPIPTES